MMNNCIKRLNKTNKFKINDFLEKYKVNVRSQGIFVNRMAEKLGVLFIYSKNLEYCQLYFDNGDGFKESNSVKVPYYLNDNIYSAEYIVAKECKNIRVDFINKELINIKRVILNDEEISFERIENCIVIEDNCYSINDDPYFIIDGNIKKINIQLEFEYNKGGELFGRINNKLNNLEQRNKELEEQNRLLERKNVVKRVRKVFKRK